MKADGITLQGLLTPANQYVIPMFQRYYSWGRKDWERLWEDLIELQDPDQPSQSHFMGSLVFISDEIYPNVVPVFQVIDGQQRLITMSLLLCALRNVAHSRGFAELASEITSLYLIQQYKKGQERFRVFPRQRDRDQYIAAIEQSGLASGRIGEALDYFSGQIVTIPAADTETVLREFFGILQARLEFVYIKLQGENPYQVFKSLNSTGVDLSEADLIRNFMFMHLSLDAQDNFDDKHWKPLEKHFESDDGQFNGAALSSFFRNFLMKDGKYVPPTATFQSFEQRYENTGFSPIELAQELMKHVGFYETIRGKKSYPLDIANRALSKLQQLESSTTYPLLLNLLNRVQNGAMSDAEFVAAVELLAGFILRRFICGDSSRAYGRWFVSACTSLGEESLAGLHSFLMAKGFPSDDRFKASMLRYPLYGSNYARAMLEALERAKLHKEPADLSEAQIEHIMPQTLSPEWKNDLGSEGERIHSEWLHSLGNLTLSAYNPELQNKPFAFKKQAYAMSNISLTRQLANHDQWVEADIISRGEQLAEVAARLWVGPDHVR